MTAECLPAAGARSPDNRVDIAEEILVTRAHPRRQPQSRDVIPQRDPSQGHCARPWPAEAAVNPSAVASSFSASVTLFCDS